MAAEFVDAWPKPAESDPISCVYRLRDSASFKSSLHYFKTAQYQEFDSDDNTGLTLTSTTHSPDTFEEVGVIEDDMECYSAQTG